MSKPNLSPSAALPTPAARANTPQPAEPAAAEPSGVFRDPEIGLEVSLPGGSWRAFPTFPGARALLVCEKTKTSLLILWEHEQISAGTQSLIESFAGLAKQTLDRFFPEYKPLRFSAQRVAGQPAKVFYAACGTDTSVLGILLPVHGWLVKLLVHFRREPKDEAARLLQGIVSAIHLLLPPSKWPEAEQSFVPYDVRLGVPAAAWHAVSGGAGRQVAVCHNGQYEGLLSVAQLQERLAAKELSPRSLVLVDAPQQGQGKRWMPLGEVADRFPELRVASPLFEAAQFAAGIAAIIALVLGIPYGIYSACTTVSGSEALRAAVEGGMLLIGSVCVGVPMGLFGLKPALKMLARDPMQGMIAILFCIVCATSPLWVLGIAGASLFAAGWYLVKWLAWLVWIVLVFLLVCCPLGGGIGALVFWLRQQNAAAQKPPPLPYALPPASIDLWAPAP